MRIAVAQGIGIVAARVRDHRHAAHRCRQRPIRTSFFPIRPSRCSPRARRGTRISFRRAQPGHGVRHRVGGKRHRLPTGPTDRNNSHPPPSSTSTALTTTPSPCSGSVQDRSTVVRGRRSKREVRRAFGSGSGLDQDATSESTLPVLVKSRTRKWWRVPPWSHGHRCRGRVHSGVRHPLLISCHRSKSGFPGDVTPPVRYVVNFHILLTTTPAPCSGSVQDRSTVLKVGVAGHVRSKREARGGFR